MKINFFFPSLLVAVVVLIFAGCSQDDDSGNLATGNPVEIQFSVGSVLDYEGDTSAGTRSPAESFKVSVPIDDNYEIEATFTPLKTKQTRAGGSTLAENTCYRVLAYRGGTAYSGYADYKIKSGKSVLIGGGLRLASGPYKFIAYSYNDGNAIIGTPNENTGISELPVSTNNDFLYWQSELNISGNTSLTIGFRHLFPQLQVVFDSTEFGRDFTAANAVLTVGNSSPYTYGNWTVMGEDVNVDTFSAQDGRFVFSSVSGKSITSEAKKLLPISNTASTPLKLTVGATFANGKTVSDTNLSLAVANNVLKSNTAYVCTVKFRPSGVYMDEISGDSYGGGNCWVIPKSIKDITYFFSAVEGRSNDKVGTTVSGKGVPDGAEVVWQIDGDGNETTGLIKDVSYNPYSNKMSFTAGIGKFGNAIIAVKAGSTILWSWHIWAVSDNSFMSNPIRINGVGEFMDRNLGAFAGASNSESRGLFYQWGRKDPIRRDNPEIDTSPKDISTITQNPNVFYGVNWIGEVLSDKWKDKYNPCPKGWTVPKHEVLELLVKLDGTWLQQNLYTISGMNGILYFSLGGGYLSENGALQGEDEEIYYWCTETWAGIAKYMMALTSNSRGQKVQVTVAYTDAYGFYLRCIRE